MRRLVGLVGYAGSGKDTGAALLVDLGWTRVAFADPLKDIAVELGWNGQKDDAGRELLQNLGLAVRNHVHPDAWVTAAARVTERIDGDVVVTDVRFPNEAAWVRGAGGLLVRIDRPGNGPANGHVSERIDNLGVDAVVVNDGSRERLAERIAILCAEWVEKYA